MIPNDIIITIIAGTIILIFLVGFTLPVLLAYQKRHYKHLQQIHKMKETFQQEILKTQLEIKEQTLQNISQEIHDNIGQVLSLANLQLTAIELPGNSFASKKIERSMELVSKAISDLRDLSKSLNAENIAKIGLTAAIRHDLEVMEKSELFTTFLEVSGEEKKLDFSKEIIIYRIIQEALNNIIKHAQASTIHITCSYNVDELMIVIADNGKGFDHTVSQTNNKHGAGLENMTSRARLIQATIDIESVMAQGTKVQIRMPFNSHN